MDEEKDPVFYGDLGPYQTIYDKLSACRDKVDRLSLDLYFIMEHIIDVCEENSEVGEEVKHSGSE